MRHNIISIYPTGRSTNYHVDFNPIPAPTYYVEMTVGNINFRSDVSTESDIRDAFGLSKDAFDKLVEGY